MTDPSANELVGQLTLADSMLGEVVGDVRRILAYANWPGTVREPMAGTTTGKAAERLAKELGHEAALASAALVSWIAQVAEVTEHRNRVVHAIALNQCMNCGEATMFRHPRSGDDVDRSPEAVASVVGRYKALRADGLARATELSEAVNQRILIEAKKIANATGEIQNPPQIYPHHVEHLCPRCTGERGSTVVHLGTAVTVIPTERWQAFRDGYWPPRDNT
ncbi:hypothetical protein [Phytohabitans aurantiacus]|uniref:DUF222 domain-containing protein n=1 Tax=Phytohabitans aurantiacus TaxID=3016789 RepID=A0ABQ5R8J8_9ACTN|nr:hypothetical protein [Phytohabitans aurantiacus]GLI02921.1 hypothetical protein Pa4123_81990 [Phytohabitans aurantiacus]